MTAITAEEIEFVARTICVAHGHDPDEFLQWETSVNGGLPPPPGNAARWEAYRKTAITQIAAFRALFGASLMESVRNTLLVDAPASPRIP